MCMGFVVKWRDLIGQIPSQFELRWLGRVLDPCHHALLMTRIRLRTLQ